MNNCKKVIKSRSRKNGIVFYSDIIPSVGLETFFDDSGNIQSRIILKHLPDFLDYLVPPVLIKQWMIIAFDAILIIISAVASIIFKNFCLGIAAIYFCLQVSFKLFNYVNISYKIKSENDKGMYYAKFHSAEHMIFNAYESLQKIPTLEEIKNFSRFKTNCKYSHDLSQIFCNIIACFVLAFLPHYNIIIYILVIVFLLIFMEFAEKKGWLNFLQIFVTSEPSDKELELAIEGLKRLETIEEKLKNQEI